ncbi:MAG: antibiotic biosynthesis monooxygenase [Spirochaetes bacterium GWF1_31_7]|nr:MAG: antibiotic biosynthesis monooxygenase [Spirochaetes bacterium GWE1_32_154]OHD51189.1 MAG: antibiotic biosynthesis monooxygenase [Spirochaetes bacterium GWE2_31_10]OHD52108.1 MAG: antibiotic biosynthesis monooxygenase [Spirochaetes bacterium GWF1_31_7]OHD79757.1 MAG: antibiotic biosynthesis monooxygenase [Spirochaetes bacterium RIFOXYB1_FULL_32_8]HBD93283.1 antibiotic biosynthesis monooxygenase [Spirochaetia bacterium]
MIVTIVSVHVKKEHLEDFIQASIENHHNSLKEPGNLRFDILQNAENPQLFTLYEAYISKEAAAVHKETGHYKKWRDTVSEWMVEPRKGVLHNIIAPLF